MVRNGMRLALGAVRFVVQKPHANPKLLSVDVFATILDRSADDDAAWRASTLAVYQVLHQRGHSSVQDLMPLRREVEDKLSAELISAGKDPEFSHAEGLKALLVSVGAGDWAASEAIALAAVEVAHEARLTRTIPDAAAWIAAEAASGRRVVAVSDTRYTSEEVSALLKHHGIFGISKVYASADHRANKFSGRLFDIVAREEGVEPSHILHAGDNLLADCLAPAQRRIRARRMRRSAPPPCAADLPAAPADSRTVHADAFATGYQTIGPILVAFVRLLLDRAMQDGTDRLAFVARDGELPLEVARIITAERPGKVPKLTYVHLSRRAVACASDDLFRMTEDRAAIGRLLKEVSIMRGGTSQLERVCNMFGLPVELLAGEASRMGLVQDSASEVCRLLSDPLTAAAIRQCIDEQRSLLLRYLRQEDVLDPSTALVDIGWRGSIQRALAEFPMPDGLRVPSAYYLGLWDEVRAVSPKGNAVGILCDQRRKTTLLEASASHAAYLLESVCRADHGMVIGFRAQPDGTVLPLHCEIGSTREAERQSESTRKQVRDGVLAYARWFASEAACAPPQEHKVRRAAQERLFRLAFFPRAEERAVGRLFVHSEPTSDDWSLPLIMTPGRGLAGRLKGARSPWKGGYFRDTGGIPLAAAYCLAEKILSWCAPGTKLKLRQLLLGEG
jgi:FMN phosphatase YigB (HAD superfamily)